MKDHDTSTYKYLWDVSKVVLGGKFIALNTFIKIKKY